MKFCALKADFPNGLVLGSHGRDAGNSTSMSSGSGDGGEGFSLTLYRLSGVCISLGRLSAPGKQIPCSLRQHDEGEDSEVKSRSVVFLQDSPYGTLTCSN